MYNAYNFFVVQFFFFSFEHNDLRSLRASPKFKPEKITMEISIIL